MKLSSIGADFIKSWEGLRMEAYRDGGGVWTIGYGHTAAAGGLAPSDGMTITHREADALFESDIGQYEDAVNWAIKVSMEQREFDAFVSLCFNIGAGAFAASTAAKRFNKGDKKGAAEAILWWNKDNGNVVAGLVNRRMAEVQMFLASPPVPMPRVASGGEAKPASQSTTLKASGAGAFGTVVSGAAAIGSLDGTAQIIAIVGALVILAAFAWVARERLAKLADGI
jgi:lysozyme